VLVAEASDGYRVAFALAELDPGTGDTQVLLAHRMNGAALDGEVGPLRLVVPKDKRPARWIRQLSTLHVTN
jgi:DMSO/TMAO reductase YedYZ molybdopterin-dependent catalytic subunit